MENWVEVWRMNWRNEIARLFSDKALEALRTAILTDDPKLIQRQTVASDDGVEISGACGLAFGVWAEEKVCGPHDLLERFEAKFGLCRVNIWPFVSWYDSAPRHLMRSEFVSEIHRELRARKAATAPK